LARPEKRPHANNSISRGGSQAVDGTGWEGEKGGKGERERGRY